MSDQSVHLVLCGGTIDKHYDAPSQLNQMNEESIVPAYLYERIKSENLSGIETFCLKDSNDIDDKMLEQLCQHIQALDQQRIIVTYGTDKMVYAAQFVQERVRHKIVIFTGAMVPLKEFVMSDGGFNLGYAMALAQMNNNGTYIAMHGRCFDVNDVRKNHEFGRFETITD